MTHPIKRRGVARRYSDSVEHNGVIYLVEVPPDGTADVATQIRGTLASIERQLAHAGSSKARLLMCTVYLPDLKNAAVLNPIWEDWLPEGCAPSRACVQAQLVDPAWQIEIAVTAATGVA